MDKAKAEKREKMQKIEVEIYNGELRSTFTIWKMNLREDLEEKRELAMCKTEKKKCGLSMYLLKSLYLLLII